MCHQEQFGKIVLEQMPGISHSFIQSFWLCNQETLKTFFQMHSTCAL